MAHPLTQQPSSTISFPFAARPSPLTFGFGLPSAAPSEAPTHMSSTHSPHRITGPACSSPSRNSFARPIPSQAFTPPTRSLKRTRRSRSPSTSPTGSIQSPRSRSPTPVSSRLGSLPSTKGLRTGPSHASKTVKRSKLQNSTSDEQSAEGVDIGIMLAALPPSAHLPILLQLMQLEPSLSSTVLGIMPKLEFRSCLKEMERLFAEIEKLAGPVANISFYPGALAESRRWDRVSNHVEVYCRTVSTYIKCFTSSNQQPAIDCPTLFLFLESHTRHLLTILSYIPSSSQLDGSTSPPASLVLDLAKLSLTIWSSWVSDLSSDVNDKGGMYPHSVVTHWNDTLEQLVVGPPSLSSSVLPPSNASARGSHWLSSTPLTAGANQPAKLLVSSFQEAFTPIRDQFVSQVGWLVGRQPSMEYN
ncbi:hypothetical protein I315_02178 [Cryptococcus gattii Ru294]|uniref:Uncharacterized protein n=2 Tax=Cryptococcus gattii TaxID=37769 RepID=E6R3D8_CRYGW|nr:Hypothetical Protein CGB_C4230C [Cryptococcus gattii WM276]KIR55589.1 hypothetical protein I315_02178 [Cryptococcus gattii Ru294]KIR82089.1 hypothetical protein I306_00822 [Cryptococcus gattii EJB2]KIY31178.1 hypothetical protein I305_06467 [Cryptococcus gattii E566]KJD99852.1 hypothetical protein I311_06561 [Cryptococcus gattii NT-10]ADV21044.1 Hypothetical Protein CGB_C4230C [Cryptococcus gattii WM276]